MHLRGPLALLLCNLAPEVYKPYLQTGKNSQPMLYVCTLNALYGTMKVALLYYQHFVRDIKSKVFNSTPMTHASQTRSLTACHFHWCGTWMT